MSSLKTSHIGSGPNRVEYDSDRKWRISPPLNYALSSSLPNNQTAVDTRKLKKLKKATSDLSKVKMAIQQQPQKTQLQLKNGFDLACASEMEVDLTGHQFSPGPASEVDTATAVLVEQALTTVDTAHG